MYSETSLIRTPKIRVPLPQPGGKLRRLYIARMRKMGRLFIIAHLTPRRTAAVFHDVGEECR